MKRLLLVDDEQAFLKSLSEGLASFASLEIRTAQNGREAVDVLSSERIDLMVTDLQMPEMGGFELLAYVSRNHPQLPVIVMTAFATPTTHDRIMQLGALACIDKPLDFDELAAKIFETLLERHRSSLPGVSVASFLQLANLERLSCRVTVTHGPQVGVLMLSEGELANARFGEISGEEAAIAIIGWNPSILDVETIAPFRERQLDCDLGFIIMESIRRADEQRDSGPRPPTASAASTETDPAVLLPAAAHSEPADGDAPAMLTAMTVEKEDQMALEQILQALRDVNGYKASAIMNFTGEPLAVDSVDPSVDLGLVGATFNDIFRAAHEASRKIGLEATREAVFKTPKGLVIMQCSGVDSKVHVHAVMVLSADGNQALAKMRLDGVVPKAMAEL